MKKNFADRDDRMYVECDCSQKTHIVEFGWQEYKYTGGSDIDFYVQTQMYSASGFFQRILTAFKHIFNLSQCNFGAWSCCLVDVDQAKEMRDILDRYISKKEFVHFAQEGEKSHV